MMKNSADSNKNEPIFSDYSEQYQEEDHLQSQSSNIHQNNHGVGMKTFKKVMLPLIFMVLLAFICLFSFSFMQKIKDNRQIMINIILSEQKNHEEFQEQINSLVELKQQASKYAQTNSGMQKDGSQLLQKLQSRLKQFDLKIDNLQKRLQRLGGKTSEKEDVAKLAIIQANQIKKQLKLAEYTLIENKTLSINQNDQDLKIKSLFTIPKNIWIFSEEHPSYLRKRYIENIKFYGNLAGFSVQLLNFESANSLLSKSSLDEIKRSMALIRIYDKSITKESLDKLQIKLILLNFLNQYGGIAMDGNMAISEDIKWIESILQNKCVHKYGKDVPPQIVGFYRSERSYSEIEQQNIADDESNHKFKYPMMEYFFIAAGRTTIFLPQYINTIHTILQNMSKTVNLPLKRQQKNKRQRQFHEQILDLAYRNLLKQKQYNLNSLAQSNKLVAYDYYGLNLINAYYGPLKMQMIYELHPSSTDLDQFTHRLYDQFAHSSMEDYITLYGPIKYLFRLPFNDKMNHFIEGSSKLMDTPIYQDSVIHKIFYPQKPKELFIKKNPFFSFTQPQVKLWETLPKIIWVYQTDKQSPFSRLCMNRLQQMAKESEFDVRQITRSNIMDHLQSNRIEQIKETVKNVNPLWQQTIFYQLYKLAILQKHGGVFLNSTTLALQNFNWILKISNMPTQFLYNYFDANPKILMMWDPLLSQPQSWNLKQLESYMAVKSQSNQAILDTFIAVEKDNELIKEWFYTIKQLAIQSISSVSNQFKEYGLQKYGLLSSPSTLSSDVLRYILAKKQREIKQLNNISFQNSAEYYKLWTLNAFTSSFKISSNFNYQNIQSKLNSHLFAYSQNYVQGIVGKIRYMLTFSNSQVVQIDKILKENIDHDASPLFDPNSIFMKNLRTVPPRQMITSDRKQIKAGSAQQSSVNSTQTPQMKT